METPRLLFYALICAIIPEQIRLPDHLPPDIDYPEYDEVLEMYAVRFSYDLQQARDILPEPGKLESVLHRPQQHAHYKDANFARQAAILAHAISEGHTFSDGNKRLAYVVTIAFLLGHGFRLGVSRARFTAWMVMLSEPETGETRDRWTIDEFDRRLRQSLTLCPGDLLRSVLTINR